MKIKELKVKLFLTYQIPERKKKRIWRPWGSEQTENDLNEEINRINKEIKELLPKKNSPAKYCH